MVDFDKSCIRLQLEEKLVYGHRLWATKGPCRNIHGHNARVLFEFVGLPQKSGIESGMVCDFGVVKKIVREFLRPYDHGLFLHQDDPLVEKLDAEMKMCADAEMKICTFGAHPTAEFLAWFFFVSLKACLTASHPHLVSVTFWESETAAATFSIKDQCEQRRAQPPSGGNYECFAETWEEVCQRQRDWKKNPETGQVRKVVIGGGRK